MRPDDERRARLPVKLLNEYDAAWDRYTSLCRRCGPKDERAEAYKQARAEEDKLTEAVEVMRARSQREKSRLAPAAPNKAAQKDAS